MEWEGLTSNELGSSYDRNWCEGTWLEIIEKTKNLINQESWEGNESYQD